MKDIDQYADWTLEKWYQAHDGVTEKDLSIMTLGLAGETGEVVEIIKKKFRDGQFDKEHLKSELGDVMYYWARICKAFDIKPSEVLDMTVAKLNKPRVKMTKDQLLLIIKSKIDEDFGPHRLNAAEYAEDLIMMVLNSGVKK